MSLPYVCVQVPEASDRTQVEPKEVRLSDMSAITLDDTDVQIVSFPSQSRYMMRDTPHLHDIARNACKLHNLLYMLFIGPQE